MQLVIVLMSLLVAGPVQATGLSVTPASSSSTSLTWTAASDAGGIGVYTVRRCQGTGCTGFVNITQTASLVYTDTGLSASTTYRYQVAAQDLAGNIGAYQSTSGDLAATRAVRN